jgi:hypothetical protein
MSSGTLCATRSAETIPVFAHQLRLGVGQVEDRVGQRVAGRVAHRQLDEEQVAPAAAAVRRWTSVLGIKSGGCVAAPSGSGPGIRTACVQEPSRTTRRARMATGMRASIDRRFRRTSRGLDGARAVAHALIPPPPLPGRVIPSAPAPCGHAVIQPERSSMKSTAFVRNALDSPCTRLCAAVAVNSHPR